MGFMMNAFAVAAVLIFIILLIFFLLGPFSLYIYLGKDERYLQSFYKLSFLGIPIKKGEILLLQPEATEKTADNQEAISSKMIETSEIESDRNYEDSDIDVNRKQKKIRPHTQIRLLVDAFPQIARIIVDLIKSINISRFSCEISFGLDDPVDTAMLNGYLWSIIYATGLYKTNILIEPRFDGEQFEGSILAVLETSIMWFVVAAAKVFEDGKTRKLIFKLVMGEFR